MAMIGQRPPAATEQGHGQRYQNSRREHGRHDLPTHYAPPANTPSFQQYKLSYVTLSKRVRLASSQGPPREPSVRDHYVGRERDAYPLGDEGVDEAGIADRVARMRPIAVVKG